MMGKKYVTEKFQKEHLREILWDDAEGYETISDEIYETSRWSVHSELIFKRVSDGRIFKTNYSRGATEQQDEQPFEYEPNEIDVYVVVPVEKTVIDYVVVEATDVPA